MAKKKTTTGKPQGKHAASQRPKRPTKKRVGAKKTSTTSTPTKAVEDVEVVEGASKKPEYEWQMEKGLDHNFHQVGKVLASLNLGLYQHAEGGLMRVDGGRIQHISTAKQLSPLLIDSIHITVTKHGKYHGEKPNQSILGDMLLSKSFLDNFCLIEEVVTTPVSLPNFTPSKPGWNEGGILHLGSAASINRRLKFIPQFLNVMEWHCDADRTNAVAALLTVPMRRHFSGGKPIVLVTANKSHAGKGTVVDFIRCNTPKAELRYESVDWPMQRSLHVQVEQYPELGVVNIDNVRTDSSGRAKLIRSGFLESTVTSAEIILTSASRKPVRLPNRFLFLLNTNVGALSVDLLNRSLPIRLNPTGDLQERIGRTKDVLGGDIKHEWLPAHLQQIEAEAWGMVERWIKEGKPLDTNVKHPMGPWAQTIGGILMVNGFKEFLANYNATKATADPIREALSILAFHSDGKPQRARVLAKLAISQGLAKVLFPGVDSMNEAACERSLGFTLKPYVGETFSATTATEKITYRLAKQQSRFDEKSPHFRYTFEEIDRQTATPEDLAGLVLEERTADSDSQFGSNDLDLDGFQPEEI